MRNLESFRSSEWKQALKAFDIYFDGRIPIP